MIGKSVYPKTSYADDRGGSGKCLRRSQRFPELFIVYPFVDGILKQVLLVEKNHIMKSFSGMMKVGDMV